MTLFESFHIETLTTPKNSLIQAESQEQSDIWSVLSDLEFRISKNQETLRNSSASQEEKEFLATETKTLMSEKIRLQKANMLTHPRLNKNESLRNAAITLFGENGATVEKVEKLTITELQILEQNGRGTLAKLFAFADKRLEDGSISVEGVMLPASENYSIPEGYTLRLDFGKNTEAKAVFSENDILSINKDS